MTAAVSIVREESVAQLESLCRALAQALAHGGLGAAPIANAFRLGLSAECARCQIRLSGEELFALSQPPAAESATAKLGRLRLGYCARDSCESYVYRLTFWNSPALDWRPIMPQAELIRSQPAVATGSRLALLDHVHRAVRSSLVPRALAMLALGALLLLMWQLRRGGSIPLLRQPEHFQVTVAPADGEE